MTADNLSLDSRNTAKGRYCEFNITNVVTTQLKIYEINCKNKI